MKIQRRLLQRRICFLDIKHTDAAVFKELTGRGQEPLFKLIEVINRLEKPIWVRQVIVPGLNDTKAYIEDLNGFLSNMKTVKKVELLGYHNMAEKKYEKLGLDYRLKGWSQWIKTTAAALHSAYKIKATGKKSLAGFAINF